MTDTIGELMAGARLARNERRMDDALLGYTRAAQLARESHNPSQLSHALRHVSDLARELGRAGMALTAGKEAVDLVRAAPDSPHLDLANALRVTALAWQALGRPDEAAPLWREARDLYASANVPDGVTECEENLASANSHATRNSVLLVFAHHRRDSLTGQVADRFARVLAANGYRVEFADLVAEGFDPVLRQDDEPDWDHPDKVYSPAVLSEMERIRRNDATIMVFPVYSWSVPAILKGWLDRVWNYGFAYGPRKYPHRRAWMIGVAGNTREDFAKRRYDEAMQISLDLGLLGYCRIADRRLELLHGSTEGPQYPPLILQRAEEIATDFCTPNR